MKKIFNTNEHIQARNALLGLKSGETIEVQINNFRNRFTGITTANGDEFVIVEIYNTMKDNWVLVGQASHKTIANLYFKNPIIQ